jgi:hypothetical protein
MKILSFFLCAVLLGQSSWAEPAKRKPASENGQKPHILQMDEDFPIEALESVSVEVHPISEIGKHSQTLPAPVLEQFFLECDLTPFLKNWDGFEKDRLALRAENQDSREVFTRYEGRIPEESIRKLKGMIKEYRRRSS